MKHIVFDINDKQSRKNAIRESQKSIYNIDSSKSSQLVQIFTAITDEKQIKKIITKYKKYFPNALIIGTTTAGEIVSAKMQDDSTVISLSLFEKTRLKVQHVKKIEHKSGRKLASKICNDKTKATIVLSEGLTGEDYAGFLEGFKEEHPDIIVAGGLAGDNFKLQKTLVFLNDNIYDTGSVAVSFSGKSLFADNRYNLNWTPIGKEFTVTSSTKNIIHTIDNIKTVPFFKKYLGEEIFADDAKALSDFQLLYKDGTTVVARTPMAVDGESIIFAAPIEEGQVVQFGFSNASSIIAGSNMIKKNIEKSSSQAIYIFSCIARKTLLGIELEKEFKNFEKIAPTAGFFTYGEYYSTNQNNALLNCTTTLLVLSESTKKIENNSDVIQEDNKEDNRLSEIGNVTFTALTNFVKQTAYELDENVKLLNQYKNAVDATLYVSKTNIKGIITFVNDNFCRISKYSREELVGQPHSIIRDSSVSDSVFENMWKTIKSGKTWKGSLPNRTKDGSIYYVNATINPTYDNKGKIDGYIAIRLDITKEILAQKKMKEKEKLIKVIFDNQDNIVIYSSKKEGMLNINKTFFQYFDFKDIDEFKSKYKCICDLFIKENGYIDPVTYPDWLDKIVEDDKTDYKVKMLSKEDKIHTFTIKIKKIDTNYIINFLDITTLEYALQKAYASEQAKSIFLSNMSHEIRTPLNGILGFADLLKKGNLDKDSTRYVDIINKSGQTLLAVVNDILDFSKLESGELSLHEIDVNLVSEMEASVATFALVSKSKQIDYFTYIDTNIPKTLKCDSQRLKQVLINLTSNAIKFTPEYGKVAVNIKLEKIQKNKATISFSVEDSGIGIKKEKQSTIFQPFSQADNSISREFGGTGLGLAISSQYVEMMGGKLEVKSELGVGSDFYFRLKLPIVDGSEHMTKDASITDKNITILQPITKIECGIYDVIKSYLQGWMCSFTTIKSVDDIDDTTDIVIVCAKHFENKACQEVLNIYEKLQLIYVEGGDEVFQCSHKKFHLIEQPMTGSMLFDKLITLANPNLNHTNTHTKQNSVNYNGNILVVEDNETNQMLIGIMLDQRGLTYTITNNGEEAVAKATNNEYDIIFMDINMPVMDGISATKILRKKNYNKPIVSLSANVIESDVKKFLEAGVNDTLNKPIVEAQLDAVLTKYLALESKEESIVFDKIDVEKLGDILSLSNKEIILKLLNSFKKTAQDMVQKIEMDNLDKELIHTLKGSAGNLRFNEIYNITKKFEDEYDGWSDDENIQNSKMILSHLKEAIKNIELL